MLQREHILPRRSAMPMVLGILAIVFSAIGLFGIAVLAFGFDKEMARHHVTYAGLGDYGTWIVVYSIVALAVFASHLTAGILGVRYSRRAPNVLTLYAIAALVLLVADVTLSVVLSPVPPGSRGFDDIVGPRLGLEFLALPWPIVVLVLANLRRTREACTR